MQGSIPKRDKKKKNKEPMGVGESFAFLAKNPYIRDLAFLVRTNDCLLGVLLPWKQQALGQVARAPARRRASSLAACPPQPSTTPPLHPPPLQVVAYGVSINLVEVTWKSKIKAQFPNPNDYSAFMGDFSTATGAWVPYLL